MKEDNCYSNAHKAHKLNKDGISLFIDFLNVHKSFTIHYSSMTSVLQPTLKTFLISSLYCPSISQPLW